MEPIFTKLAGVTFGDCQQNIRLYGNAIKLGIYEYDLIREPENPHDPYAVRVCFVNFCLGYLPTPIAEKIAPFMDAGRRFEAEFVSLNRSPYHDTVGLTVKIIEY